MVFSLDMNKQIIYCLLKLMYKSKAKQIELNILVMKTTHIEFKKNC